MKFMASGSIFSFMHQHCSMFSWLQVNVFPQRGHFFSIFFVRVYTYAIVLT